MFNLSRLRMDFLKQNIFCCIIIFGFLSANDQVQPNQYQNSCNFMNSTEKTKKTKYNGPDAIWIQLALGTSSGSTKSRSSSESFYYGEFSLHVNKNKHLFSGGINGGTNMDSRNNNTYWVTYGLNHGTRFIDSSINAGIGLSKYQYHSEGPDGTMTSSLSPGVILKAQTLLHFPSTLGIGIVLTGNLSIEVSYVSVCIAFALGGWNSPSR